MAVDDKWTYCILTLGDQLYHFDGIIPFLSGAMLYHLGIIPTPHLRVAYKWVDSSFSDLYLEKQFQRPFD